jgi:hypothetical protein
MPRNDQKIPKRTEKLLYQEASSRCSFCTEAEIALLDIHHIEPRASGGSNDLSNLILVCKNCHARVESGAITHAELVRKKREIRVIPLPVQATSPKADRLFIGGDVNDSIVGNSITIINRGKSVPRMAHPRGTIGADAHKKNYVEDLIRRYHDLREADTSYGRIEPSYNYAVVHKNVERRFRAKTYFIPESRFDELVRYLQTKIDRTIQGKRNRRNKVKNYSSFDEYVRTHGG